ncbi:MAG: hypothetical protein PHI87_05050 [Candidatus Methanomethylophilus sp.]|nr:hypothetical protein [Methanomethylophilus sp.]MDD4222630.1 hypothetical protein [Methanomethylophilus sp.]MDD4669056.1 hypothetical protein [Methanomethylophilus sp.]
MLVIGIADFQIEQVHMQVVNWGKSLRYGRLHKNLQRNRNIIAVAVGPIYQHVIIAAGQFTVVDRTNDSDSDVCISVDIAAQVYDSVTSDKIYVTASNGRHPARVCRHRQPRNIQIKAYTDIKPTDSISAPIGITVSAAAIPTIIKGLIGRRH